MNSIRNWFNSKNDSSDDLSEYFKFFIEFYKIDKEDEEPLDKGSYSSVFKVTHSVDGGKFALKILEIETNKHRERDAAREIKCLRELDHPNILRYYFAFKIDKLPTIKKWSRPEDFPSRTPLFCIQTELCVQNLREKLYEKGQSGVDLSKEFQRFALQICDAVKYFHRGNIMHRDLNPYNIFLKKDIYDLLNVKVGDFGLSRFYNDEGESLTIAQLGIQYYRCLEMNNKTKYSLLCDVYSVGVLLYEMFHPELMISRPRSESEPPIVNKSMDLLRVVHENVNAVEALTRDDTTFSPQMKNLIIDMLKKEESRKTVTSEDVFKKLKAILNS